MKLFAFIFVSLLLFTTRAEEDQFEFVAEVGRLLDILINSLYTQKEIFLRELISNSADALDKVRFESIEDPSTLGTETELEIRIEFDDKNNVLSIRDNGIGMTKNDLIQNLGTVAKSGTTRFLEAIKGGNLNLIGQFGVGFYSTFLAASKVTVISKHNSDRQWKWQSSATSSFSVEQDDSIDLKRGTIVILDLK
jgi:heat shock protein beta